MFHKLNVRASIEPYYIDKYYNEDDNNEKITDKSKNNFSKLITEYVRCQKIITDNNLTKKKIPEECKKYITRKSVKPFETDIILVL
jgi:hypothetical protein